MKISVWRPLSPLTLALGLLGAAFACSSEDDAKEPAKPDGPASIAISSLIGADNQSIPRDEAGEVSICDDRLGVVLELGYWTLRPPEACRSTLQCGYVRVLLDPTDEGGAAATVEGATATLFLELAELEDAVDGAHHLRAELHNDDGTPALDETGAPLVDELDVTLSSIPCDGTASGGSGSGGSGAGGSEGGQAGAPDAGAGGTDQGAAGSGGEGGLPNGGSENGGSGGASSENGGSGGEAGGGGSGG